MSILRLCFNNILRFYFKNSRCLAFVLILCLVFFSFRILLHDKDKESQSPRDSYKSVVTNYLEKKISGVSGVNDDFAILPGSLKVTNDVSLIGSSKCILLQLDPFHVGVGQFMKDMGKLQCANPFYSKLSHMNLHVEGKGIRELSYRAILPPKGDNTSAGFELGEQNGLSSRNGRLDRGKQGNIQHALGKCVHALGGYSKPPEDGKLCLYDTCALEIERLVFMMADDGIIKHKMSGMCVAPLSHAKAKAHEETFLSFTATCDEWASFRALDNGMVQHVKSKMCIHYQSTEAVPPNDVLLVLHSNCKNSAKHRFQWWEESRATKTISIRRDVKEEFLEIELLSTRTIVGNIDKEYVMQVSPDFDLKEPPHSVKRLNFLMLMLHSTSSAHFMRKMPKSLNFLESNGVDTVILRGYSVVDESTRGQLAALLAGTSPSDFENKPIDSLPWLFKIAKEHNYVTLMNDDKTPSPMFRDVLSGFKSKPTHHYTLPFWTAANRMQQPGSNTFCLGGQPMHNVTLSYVRDFFSIYHRLPKFALAMISELSSWNPNALSYADDDLFDFLNWMKDKGHLEKTVLVLFSDHGSRHENLRGLLEGKIEERMPFLSITIPPKAPTIFVESSNNLKTNSKLLIHPFEVYETLKSMVLHHVNDETRISKGESQNLFTRLDSETRSCEQLKIPPHWCPCLNAQPLPADSKDRVVKALEEAGKQVVSHVNKILSSHAQLQNLCSELTYRSVKLESTVELAPNQEVLRFRRSKSGGKCVDCKPIFDRHSTTRKESFYVLYVEVHPGSHLLRAVVNIRGQSIFIHPHLHFVDKGKYRGCKTDNPKIDAPLLRYCICR